MKHAMTSLALLATLLAGAACSLVPDARVPDTAIPVRYKESGPDTPLAAGEPAGVWHVADPADHRPRGAWWAAFDDPTLDALEAHAVDANQDVQAAAARLRQSRAVMEGSRAAFLPEVTAGFGPTRQLTSEASQGRPDGETGSAQTLWRAQANVAWEVDLFGRVSATAEAAEADMERQAALLGAAQLAVQADVARTYFLLRQLDSELALYRDTINLREQAVRYTERQHRAGAATDSAVAQAQTELAATRAERVALQRQRALAEHALALLLGKAPADFDLPAAGLTAGQGPLRLTVPAGLPSALLERRPDIAAAERTMAAENARIGVARAAFFPSLSLTGGVGYESSALGHLFNWSQRTFLLGPLVGTALSLPIFDGGRRDADLAQARARYDERVAQYRQTVLAAFREVEDGLASLRTLDEQAVLQQGAAKASSRAADLARARYREGDADYLNVIDAERSSLHQARQVLRVEGERARNTVELMRALGGGWDAQALANATAAGAAPGRP